MRKIKKFFSHDAFSFFRMYYYILKRSPKRYNIPMSYRHDHVMAWCTPLFFIPIQLFSSIIFGNPEMMRWTFIWFPLFGLNSVVINFLRNEGREIQREFEKKRREAERMQREHEEAVRARQRAEWQEAFRKRFEQQQRYKQQQQRASVSMLDKSLSFLGLTQSASKQDVKKAYRRLSKIHHPDMGGNEKDFIKLKQHYDYVIERI